MRRHVLAVYGRSRYKFIQFRCKYLNYIPRVIEIEFISKRLVSKRLCIEMTLYRNDFVSRNDRTPSLLFKKIPNSVT